MPDLDIGKPAVYTKFGTYSNKNREVFMKEITFNNFALPKRIVDSANKRCNDIVDAVRREYHPKDDEAISLDRIGSYGHDTMIDDRHLDIAITLDEKLFESKNSAGLSEFERFISALDGKIDGDPKVGFLDQIVSLEFKDGMIFNIAVRTKKENGFPEYRCKHTLPGIWLPDYPKVENRAFESQNKRFERQGFLADACRAIKRERGSGGPSDIFIDSFVYSVSMGKSWLPTRGSPTQRLIDNLNREINKRLWYRETLWAPGGKEQVIYGDSELNDLKKILDSYSP